MVMIYFMLAFIAFFIAASIIICIKVSSPTYKIVKRKQVLQNPETWYKIPLSKIIEITHDTKIYRFEFQDPECILGLLIGSHVVLRANFPTHDHPGGENVERKYTPISLVTQKSYVDLLIKIYKKTEQFPNGGKMSQYIDSLKIGDTLEFKGPLYRFEYLGKGNLQVKGPNGFQQKKVTKLGMICGGTGITPLYQVIKHIEQAKDQIQIQLIYANRSPNDILLNEELNELEQKNKIKQYLLVDNTMGQNWTHGVGFVTKQVIQQHLQQPADDLMVLLCGPPIMTTSVKNHLIDLGYANENIFIF